MIENMTQYLVTSDALEKLEEGLEKLSTAFVHPLIAKAQEDGLRSMIGELRMDMAAFVNQERNAHMQRREQPNLVFFKLFKNTAFPGRAMRLTTFSMATTEHGILVNGDYGTNPSREEMREMLDAMRELVADWDARYKGMEER